MSNKKIINKRYRDKERRLKVNFPFIWKIVNEFEFLWSRIRANPVKLASKKIKFERFSNRCDILGQ
jgi:hypothetical protein